MTFRSIRTYRFPLTTSAVRFPVDMATGISTRTQKKLQVVLSSSHCAHVSFGDSTVAASRTPDGTTKQYPAGQINAGEGKNPVPYIVTPGTHVSVVLAQTDSKGAAITTDGGEITVEIGY